MFEYQVTSEDNEDTLFSADNLQDAIEFVMDFTTELKSQVICIEHEGLVVKRFDVGIYGLLEESLDVD